jgi:lipoate-protein ligase A
MSLDEALLVHADRPTMRLYHWAPPALSLGYFQDWQVIAGKLPAGMPVVRRITGGGAIWHEHEVTYSLVGRLGEHGLPTTTKAIYPGLHRAVLDALATRGARLDLQGETVGDRRYTEDPRCFASPAADDLIHHAGGKVLGSAARARGTQVLVHGSLKLASNPWDGAAVAPCGLGWDDAAAALVDGIAAWLGCEPTRGSVTDAEAATAAQLKVQRYGDDAWVVRREGPKA